MAYEPSPAAFEELRHTAEVAMEIDKGAIYAQRAAIWYKTGKVMLLRHPETSGGNRVVESPSAGSDSYIEVEAEPFARALSQSHWDCVKMDIEGAEYQVLSHLEPSLLDRVWFFSIEIHNDLLDRSQREFVRVFLTNHFQHHEILPVKVNGVPTEDVSALYCWR